MSRRRNENIEWYRITNAASLNGLREKCRGLYHYNTWSEHQKDRNGKFISFLQYDWKPDSDWGKFDSHLAVWFASDELYEAGIKIIKEEAHESKREPDEPRAKIDAPWPEIDF